MESSHLADLSSFGIPSPFLALTESKDSMWLPPIGLIMIFAERVMFLMKCFSYKLAVNMGTGYLRMSVATSDNASHLQILVETL